MNSLFDILANGGPVVWLLAVFSVIALTVAAFKLLQFSVLLKLNRDAGDEAMAHLQEQQKAQAVLLCANHPTPATRIIYQTLHLLESSVKDINQLREEAWRLARQHVSQLHSHLRILEVIATLAPLLGLFGTVLGMIEAFRAMESAGSQVNPAILSGGIWQALLTTAVGLAVAIPVSLLHSWLEQMANRQVHLLQDRVESTLYQISRHGWLQSALSKGQATALQGRAD